MTSTWHSKFSSTYMIILTDDFTIVKRDSARLYNYRVLGVRRQKVWSAKNNATTIRHNGIYDMIWNSVDEYVIYSIVTHSCGCGVDIVLSRLTQAVIQIYRSAVISHQGLYMLPGIICSLCLHHSGSQPISIQCTIRHSGIKNLRIVHHKILLCLPSCGRWCQRQGHHQPTHQSNSNKS